MPAKSNPPPWQVTVPEASVGGLPARVPLYPQAAVPDALNEISVPPRRPSLSWSSPALSIGPPGDAPQNGILYSGGVTPFSLRYGTS